MSGPAKAVETMTAVELLRDLANVLRWPRWFDTDEGEKYSEAVRPRLEELADRLAAVLPMICSEPHCGRACAEGETVCRKHGGNPLACGICGHLDCEGHAPG